MKDCEYYQELISGLLDSELADEEKTDLMEHLSTCSRCRFMYESFLSLSRTIASEKAEPPAELHENIMAEIRRENIRKKNRLSKPLKAVLATAACAAVVIAAAYGFSPDRFAKENAPETVSAYSADEARNEESCTFSMADSEAACGGADEIPAPEMRRYAPEPESEEKVYNDGAAEETEKLTGTENDIKSSYELDSGTFESFQTLLAGIPSDIDTALLQSVIFTVSDRDSGSTITVYSCEDSLYYTQNVSENAFLAGCGYNEIYEFLNIIS